MPTKLPLAEFYRELVTTQQAFYRKHMGWRRLLKTAGVVAGQLARGQTNFLGSLFNLERVFRPEHLLADHARPVEYEMALPRPARPAAGARRALHPCAARPQGTGDR